MDLSIIIVSWNTREVLRGCLESVYRETRGISFETLVVDNASSDGTLEMLSRDFPEVRTLANAANWLRCSQQLGTRRRAGASAAAHQRHGRRRSPSAPFGPRRRIPPPASSAAGC
jgi:glycosyltransferase involved in cell wall biosynthesis